jgi:hypothetical protein
VVAERIVVARPPPERHSPEELLGITDRHLAEADERVRHVEEGLRRLALRGRSRELTEELLATMRRSREVMLECRQTFGREAGVDDPDPEA